MTKNEKLLKRPVEEGTRILRKDLVAFAGKEALLELWFYEGVTASSIVLIKEDFIHLGEEKIRELVFAELKMEPDKQATYSDSGDYIFVNFGFEY